MVQRDNPPAAPTAAELARVAGLFGLFTSPARLGILYTIARSERTLVELGQILGEQLNSLSQHVRLLRIAGFLDTRGSGDFALHGLNDFGRVALTMVEAIRARETAVRVPPQVDRETLREYARAEVERRRRQREAGET